MEAMLIPCFRGSRPRGQRAAPPCPPRPGARLNLSARDQTVDWRWRSHPQPEMDCWSVNDIITNGIPSTHLMVMPADIRDVSKPFGLVVTVSAFNPLGQITLTARPAEQNKFIHDWADFSRLSEPEEARTVGCRDSGLINRPEDVGGVGRVHPIGGAQIGILLQLIAAKIGKPGEI